MKRSSSSLHSPPLSARPGAPRSGGVRSAEPSDPPSVPGVAVPVVQPVVRTRHCPMHKVFLHNDPVTRFNFVIAILLDVFGLEAPRAISVTGEAHEKGVAFVTALTFEQAEFRVEQAHALARSAGFPLTFTYEPE